MAEKSIIQLIKNFDPDQLKSVVLIYGSEDFLKKQFVNKLKEKFKVHILWGDEISFSDLKDIFSSSALFSEGNVAVLFDFDAFLTRLGKEEQKKLPEFFKKVSKPDRLILISKKEKLPAKEPFKAIKDLADIVVSNKLTPKAFMISLKNKIEKNGKKIDEQTLKHLSSKLKNDLWYAKQEVEKLLIYASDKESITKEDVDFVVTPKVDENVFVFLDRFFEKDPKALKILKDLIDTSHHPFEVQSLILNQINRLLIFKTLTQKGSPSDKVLDQMKIKHPAMRGTLKKQASKVKTEDLIDMIKDLYETEKKQKVEYMDIFKAVEEFVAKWVSYE
ncbi:DNA polymerase III subunit delta [Persephonella sp.]|uniref:DNA polymerase III subunit delta n=1 Tax=Persephonella sp. TaxID=2060922 RepID=UPI0025E0D1CF|nr:DNA polymerase III subunit delta [Persephonella sp.]